MPRMIRTTVLSAAMAAVLTSFLFSSAARAATILVKPGKLDHFTLTAPPSALAGESFLVRIEPFDASGNLITEFHGKGGAFSVNVSGGGEAAPSKLKAGDFAAGATVKVASKRAGLLEISVTEGEGSTPLAGALVRILPNRLDRFVVNAPSEVFAGEAFQVRVIAQDTYGNTKDDLGDVSETMRVQVQGAGSAVGTDKPLPAFRSGEAIYSFQPRKAGTVRVVVQETRTRSAGESASIQVNPAALDRLTVIGPKAAVAGEPFVVLIAAFDAFENLVTNYQAQGDGIGLMPSGAGVLAPAVIPAKEFKDGQARVTLTYTRAEPLRIAAREQNREAKGESGAILVVPGDPDQFRIETPAEAVAGEGFTAQIEALDRFGNLIDDYNLRGLEVFLTTDGRGQLSPASISPALFVKGKAAVVLQYNRAESFSVVAALSKEALEKLVAERRRQAATPPAPEITPEEIAREREREAAAQAREEAQRAKIETEKNRAREDALKAKEAAERAREEAKKAAAKLAPQTPAKAVVPTASKAQPASARPAKPVLKLLEKVTVEESKDQVLVRLATSGPVSYNASTGSRLSKEWIWLELFPVGAGDGVAKNVAVTSPIVGEITVEQTESEKVRVSIQVLPPGISYVVTQQDRAVVVKVVRTE